MKNLSTWLIALFMIMFWAFRIIVAIVGQLDIDFICEPLNQTLEIILLFVAFVSIILFMSRKLLGGLIYLLSYGIYFGNDLVNNVMLLMNDTTKSVEIPYIRMFISFIALILAVFAMLDLLVDKSKKINPKDKKTDWFYKNEKFDREMDERADKNNYRIL